MKKELTKEQIYKKNQKKSKILKNVSPFVFWGFIVLSLLCLFFTLRHSVGNIMEIMDLLDSKKYNGEQIASNYQFLIQKYGEWTIGQGSSGFTITFINIGNAMFSGLMILNGILCIFFYLSAYILGKWTLPAIAEQILQENQDMVNLTILNSDIINNDRK